MGRRARRRPDHRASPCVLCEEIGRRHPVEVEDVKFLRANTDRVVKIAVPRPFTMSQQAQNDFYHRPADRAVISFPISLRA